MKQAFMFPGQGVQNVGMIKDYFSRYHSVFQPLFDESSKILGFDIKEYMFKGPQKILDQTEITQPSILIASVGISLLLKEKNIVPDIVAGHSVGQFSALVAANALTFSDAVKMTYLRGKCMSSVEREGAMIAVHSKDIEKIEEVIQFAHENTVDIAAYNSPFQIVISGEKDKLQDLQMILSQREGIVIKPLKVSQAFHSRLMEAAEYQFLQEVDLNVVKKPTIPIILNSKADVSTSITEIIEDIKLQFTQPVLWSDTVQKMSKEGVSIFTEVGPGKVLSKSLRSFDLNYTSFSTDALSNFKKLIKTNLVEDISTNEKELLNI
ncbi:ACP S-malonyltransferase [Bacillus sp. REN10]|uniref:ACP S-malonyltransferase n=1 Tax=Bacillus sp. REN10 TaxID=2782541 RepID=UPI00193B256F|nr:ACP S-malonyltransferase [Bacillus sp. REN10]